MEDALSEDPGTYPAKWFVAGPTLNIYNTWNIWVHVVVMCVIYMCVSCNMRVYMYMSVYISVMSVYVCICPCVSLCTCRVYVVF